MIYDWDILIASFILLQVGCGCFFFLLLAVFFFQRLDKRSDGEWVDCGQYTLPNQKMHIYFN